MPTLKEAVEEIMGALTGSTAEEMAQRADTLRVIDTIRRDASSNFGLAVEGVTVHYDSSNTQSGNLRVLGIIHGQFLRIGVKRKLSRLEVKYPLPAKLLGVWDFGYSLSDENLLSASTDPLYTR